MPQYLIAKTEIDIPRDAVFLDTNVLVAAFRSDDQWHDMALAFLQTYQGVFLIPVTVVVETWGVLVRSKQKNIGKAFSLLAWLEQPGIVIVLPAETNYLERIHNLITSAYIDWIDAMLTCFGDRVTQKCGLNPPIQIATFDTKDFYEVHRHGNFRFSLLDLKSGHVMKF